MEKSTSSSCAATNESTRVTVDADVDKEEEALSCRPSLSLCLSLDGSGSGSGSGSSPDYSDAEDECWHSPYTSNGGATTTYGDSNANTSDPEIVDLPRPSVSDNSNSDLDVDVDLEKGGEEVKESESIGSGSRSDKECRICHLGVEEAGASSIVLGCACKADLAVAHKHCAEAWFKIKGNRLKLASRTTTAKPKDCTNECYIAHYLARTCAHLGNMTGPVKYVVRLPEMLLA